MAEQIIEKTTRPKSSKAWEHFTLKAAKDSVTCKLCNVELAWHGSTSVMNEHLKRKHVGAVMEGASDGKKQLSMSSYVHVGNKAPCSPQQAAVLTQSVLNMIVTDMRPLSIVEDDGFRQMVKTLHSGYTLPSRTHFTKLMEKKYEKTSQEVKMAINANKSKVALTADAWTSVATEAYLGITCHYIKDDWKMESVCLTTMPLQDRHTASNIAGWLLEAVAKFEIPLGNVIAIVHDNGANIVAAAKILEEQHGWASVRCTGHTLQLVITSALKNATIDKTIGSARCLVEHFKRSELACTKLAEKQQQMAVPQHMLIQDVNTRWNSQYYMICRLLEQRWPVTATLSDSSVTQRGKRYLDLKPEQWTLLEELSTVLEAFEVATVYMSGERYITISAIPPLVKGLMKSTQSAADIQSAPVKAFLHTASEQLRERWERETSFSDTAPNTVILSTALDPRFKRLKFLTPAEVLKVQTKVQTLALRVRREMDEEQHASLREPAAAAAEPTMPVSLLDSLLASGNSSDEEGEMDTEQDVTSQVRNEVLTYFGEKPLAKDKSPLDWWKANQDRYPILAKLARSYLCIPGTSTPSERLFSAAGNIASKKRASLSQEHVDMLTFLHCNAKFL